MALLRAGVFDRIVEEHMPSARDLEAARAKSEEAVAELSAPLDAALLLVCALLFGRRPLHSSFASAPAGAFKVSTVLLRRSEQRGDVLAVLDAANARCLSLFGRFMRAYAMSLPAESAAPATLPLSRLVVGRAEAAPAATAGGGLLGTLSAAALKVTLRSPFSAMRGTGDDQVGSVEALSESARSDVFIDPATVPVFDETGELLDRYILDFYSRKCAGTRVSIVVARSEITLRRAPPALCRFRRKPGGAA